jgi:cytochrome b subunit of formate dehydrogenase
MKIAVSRTPRNRAAILAILPFLSLLFSLCHDAAAQDNAVCIECHGKRDIKPETGDLTRPLFVDESPFIDSTHGDLECIDCHTDLDGQNFPHEEAVAPVDCAECHDEVPDVLADSQHGRALARGDARAPSCADCHGNHGIQPLSEKESRKAIQKNCARCHEDQSKAFIESLHGAALSRDDPLAPDCASCHGGHNVLPVTDPRSLISFHNIPRLCGACHKEGAPVQEARDVPHEDVLKNYSLSIHGEGLFKKGLTVTAVCTSCHTSHNVLAHDDPNSSIHLDNITATCMQCHILIEEVHRKVIRGEMWEKEPHRIPVCVDCHAPHEARKVFYDQGMADGDCLSCHGDDKLSRTRDGREVSLYVNHGNLKDSKHSGVACAQCHTDGTPSAHRPCSTMVNDVDCSVCHAEQAEQHQKSTHGTLLELRDESAPSCADCHDHHNVLGQENPKSPTFPANVPGLCGNCHREGEKATRREKNAEHDIVSRYSMSVHGKGLLESGLTVTAVCTDCHTAHMPLPADHPKSSVNGNNIADTCSKCHHGIFEKYRQSIHATGTATEEHPLPNCYDCHTSHSIRRIDKTGFRKDIIDKCGRCHEEVTETYFETYHGKASSLGSGPAAKCHDCHGAHDVLPTANLSSRLSRANIVATCQQCHEGATRRFAGYLTHATHHNRVKYPFLFYSFWGMTALLVGTLSMATLHTLLWLWRSIRTRKKDPHRETRKGKWHVVRFTPLQRLLHIIMLLSFLGLATTGMAVKFAYAEWAQVLIGIFGGVESAGSLHRFCALVTFGYFFAHLCCLYKQIRGKGLKSVFDKSVTMLPTLNDLQEVKATWKWFFGRGPAPTYGRWTYWEKFDYWAVFWGVAIIGSTGLMLWFPEFFTRFIPGEVLNVATIIHSDEALLAVGFIFTVHFFNTHFRPGKFPMDPVIFTGTMPLEEFKKERGKEYDEEGASTKILENLVPPRSDAFYKTTRIFGLTALFIGLTMVGLILYAMLFGYR